MLIALPHSQRLLLLANATAGGDPLTSAPAVATPFRTHLHSTPAPFRRAKTYGARTAWSAPNTGTAFRANT